MYNLAPGTPVVLTMLGGDQPHIPGVLVEIEGHRIDIAIPRAFPLGAAKVETTGLLVLGDVIGSQLRESGHRVSLVARHKLTLLPELLQLNAVLTGGESPRSPAVADRFSGVLY